MDLSQHSSFGQNIRPAAFGMRAEDYLRLLHPADVYGSAALMRLDENLRCARTYRPDMLPAAAAVWLDVSVFVSLHRYHGPRSGRRLAALNVVALDLDYWSMPRWQHAEPKDVAHAVRMAVRDFGLPLPSIITDTGRGLAILWLIDELPAAAEPRWRSAQRYLIDLFKTFGADVSCGDAARVFRVPESINLKNGRQVTVLDGSLRRYDFDGLSDAIYRAGGRPTRAELAARKFAKAERQKIPATGPSGLAPAARFRQVRSDLLTLINHWDGRVPVGLRNNWLHLFATCLTHQRDGSTLAAEVEATANRHCPDLPPSEVAGVIRAAKRRQAGEHERYFYSGARMAEMLGVPDVLAQRLKLKQIYSKEERNARRLEREACRRREKGMVPRDEYLAGHANSRDKPWTAHGYSRATWYRRGCPPPPTAKTTDPARQEPDTPRETPPSPPQGGLPRQRPRPELSTEHQPLHPSPEAARNRRPPLARPAPTRTEPIRRPREVLPDLMPTAEEIALPANIFRRVMQGADPFAAARAL